MPGKARKVVISERQQEILREIKNARTASVRDVQRATIILLAFAGVVNEEIAGHVRLERHQVGHWRVVWAKAFPRLIRVECLESPAALRKAILAVLADAPRSGSPGKFTAEQLTMIIAVACEPPAQSGRPINHWTARELADEVIKRKIVDSISITQVGRILEQAELQPHRSRYWLNSNKIDPELFKIQVETICATYLEAPRRLAEENIHTISTDEKTGIQALERIAAMLPMKPGRIVGIEFEYTRHGTVCLIGNFDVVTGRVIAPTIQATRTEEDFVKHIEQTVDLHPEDGWVFVVDNLNTHCSEKLVEFVAEKCGIEEDLGKKGKSGILKSVASRQKFLATISHRIRFVYTPKHTSWLNQIEIWFSILVRRFLKRGNFASTEELTQQLRAFIEYFNTTMAKPFKWTYTGRPLQSGVA
jgi:transposase